MDDIRLATEEEVKTIAERADLTRGCSVWAMGKDLAVVRQCIELDPVFYAEDSSNQRKLVFIWGLMNMLRATGTPEVYFNVPVALEQYRKVVEHFGAEPTSMEPEIRYKKSLFHVEKANQQ